MTTKTRVTTEELARHLAHRLGAAEADARHFLDELCLALRDCLRDGRAVELGDLISLSIEGAPEIREDESGGFSAYAPSEWGIAVTPLSSLKSELDRSSQAAIYYVSREESHFKELLAEHFGRRGWNLVHRRNGMEVLSRIDSSPPVALVFESHAEGWRELVRELKCDPRTNWVPVVGIFPRAYDEDAVRRLTVMPDDIIYEPFNFADFIKTAGAELAQRVTATDNDLKELEVLVSGTQRDRREAKHMIEEVLFREGLPEEFCSSAGQALAEALDNANRHGHEHAECCTITVRMLLDPKRLVLAVRDSGRGFDHASSLAAARGRSGRVGSTTTTGDPLRRAAAALRTRTGDPREGGIAVMLRLVDRVDYNRTGNEVVLTKFRPEIDEDTATNPRIDNN